MFYSLAQAFASALCSRHIMWALSRALARLSRLSFVFRVLRNLICTAIQGKLYPCKSSNSPHTMAWKQAVLHWIFNLVEIASARFVCKQVSPHSLTRNFQRCLLISYLRSLQNLKLKFGFCSLTRNFPPLAGNLPCNGILRELYAYNGNIKEKPAPLKDTAWSLLIFG